MNEGIWTILLLVLTAAVIVEGVILVALMRQVGGILLRLSPARPGELEGGPEIDTVVKVPGLQSGKGAIFLFLSPQCSICEPVVEAIPTLRRNYRELDVIAVVTGGDDREKEEYANRLGGVARTDLRKLHRSWKVAGTPFAVGVDSQHRVRITGVANNLEHLEALAQSVLEHAAESVSGPSGNGLDVLGDGHKRQVERADAVTGREEAIHELDHEA